MTLLYPITSWLSTVTREVAQRCREEEVRAGKVWIGFLKEITSGLSAELWGTQDGRRVCSALKTTLSGKVGLSQDSHKQLFSCHWPGSRASVIFFFS